MTFMSAFPLFDHKLSNLVYISILEWPLKHNLMTLTYNLLTIHIDAPLISLVSRKKTRDMRYPSSPYDLRPFLFLMESWSFFLGQP